MTAKRTDEELSALAQPLSMFHDLGPVDAKFCKHAEFRTTLVWNSMDDEGFPDKSKGLTLYVTDYLDTEDDGVLSSFMDTVLTRLEGGSTEQTPLEPFVSDAAMALWKTHRDRYLTRMPAMLNCRKVYDRDSCIDECLDRLMSIHALDVYTPDELRSVVLKTYSRSPESGKMVISRMFRTAFIPVEKLERIPFLPRTVLVLVLYDHMLRDAMDAERICAAAGLLSTSTVSAQQMLRELTDMPESPALLGDEAWMAVRAFACPESIRGW